MNKDKCRCECKELVGKEVCDEGYIWNPSNCECECNKACEVGEYLNHSDCKCKKKLVDELIEKCTENIDETHPNENKDKKHLCMVYKILFCIFLIISIVLSTYFVYCRYIKYKHILPY